MATVAQEMGLLGRMYWSTWIQKYGQSENGVKNWNSFTPVATITVNAFIDIL
jgi:hypothetical protein